MTCRMLAIVLAAGMAALWASAALGASRTTVSTTIQDSDGDQLLEPAPGEDYAVVRPTDPFPDNPDLRPPLGGEFDARPHSSILHFLQLSDFQMVDEESPGRVEFLDQTQNPPINPFAAAHRPQESLTTQVTHEMVRQARNTTSPVTAEQLELTILTGDNADSQQFNETRWFIDILDGQKKVDPNSGIEGTCDPDPESLYEGVQGGGDTGYWDPDASDGEDGRGYSPRPDENELKTGRRVRVRDFPTLFERAQDPFEALGLDMPWYSAFGNHDALVQGNSPEAYVGPSGASGETSNPTYQSIVTGCVKPSTAPSGASPQDLIRDPLGFGADGPLVPPDPRRCYLAKDQAAVPNPPGLPCDGTSFIGEHFKTTGEPAGHGFAPAVSLDPDSQQAGYGRPATAIANHDGYYSFTPRPGLRFVVLDTVTDECPSPETCSEGSVDDTQFNWLSGQIDQAATMGEYVLVFSHHTLRTTRFPSSDATEEPLHHGQRVDRRGGQPQNPTSATTLEELYCQKPNLLAHVSGHEHENYVERHECAGDDPPTPGPGYFVHVSTAAHIDWPQQSRTIELVDTGDGNIALVLTMLDHNGAPNPGNSKSLEGGDGNAGQGTQKLASIAREIAFNDYQSSRGARGGAGDRNVIVVLPRPWTGGDP